MRVILYVNNWDDWDVAFRSYTSTCTVTRTLGKPVTCAVSVYTLSNAVCVRPIYFINAVIDKYHKSDKVMDDGIKKISN